MTEIQANPAKKPRGLFLNPAQANCSIYESGKMVYECLLLSEKYEIDYFEISPSQRQVAGNYDFYAFNYHHETMGWLDTKSIGRLPGLKLTFVLETLPNDPFVLCPRDVFDVYCALDPTMSSADKRVYAFPRPLETVPALAPYENTDVPTIGTFGFATPGKGFELVVDAVNKEFDRAIVRINMPPGTHADPVFYKLHNCDYAEYLSESCKKIAKAGIEVVVTREYMTKSELIRWCSQNTLNCFLYDRNQPGLSATTDQAITSGRPLAVSANTTFRHIHRYLHPYPFRSLRESLELSQPEVAQIQSDWSPRQFTDKFERVLEDADMFDDAEVKSQTASSKIELAVNRHGYRRIKNLKAKLQGFYQATRFSDFVPPIFPKVARQLTNLLNRKSDKSKVASSIHPFAHGLLKNDTTLSSLDKEATAKMAKEHGLSTDLLSTGVESEPLRNILSEHLNGRRIDFMSVDAEGFDLQVLKSNDWSLYRPSVVLVEINNQYDEIVKYMSECGYLLMFNNLWNGLFIDQRTPDSDLKAFCAPCDRSQNTVSAFLESTRNS